MRIQPTKGGGRVLEGDNAWGKFRVEWDAAGKLVSESMEIRTPPATQPGGRPANLPHDLEDCSPCRQGMNRGEIKT